MDKLKDRIASTFKSSDTEEWIDVHYTRPIGFLWAQCFNHFGIYPNVVTILSIILGIGAGYMFCYSDLLHNLLGVFLLSWANIYHSTDGQLARMSGKKTRWGRILDGFEGDVWFFCILHALCLRVYNQDIRLTHHRWGILIFVAAALCGIVFHARQARLADYYRNIHLFFLRENASELDSSRQQQSQLDNTPRTGHFWWRVFLWFYIGYTKAQERATPQFQKLYCELQNRYPNGLPEKLRQDFRQQSLPLMKWANALTFNLRALCLYACCLLDIPWLYLLIEAVPFTIIAAWMHHRHETICQLTLNDILAGKY